MNECQQPNYEQNDPDSNNRKSKNIVGMIGFVVSLAPLILTVVGMLLYAIIPSIKHEYDMYLFCISIYGYSFLLFFQPAFILSLIGVCRGKMRHMTLWPSVTGLTLIVCTFALIGVLVIIQNNV